MTTFITLNLTKQIVRNFGTEDRVLEKSRKLAGTTTIQDYVTFMSTDIKDLFVHETSAEAAPQVVAPTTSVPTISAQATPKMQQQQAPRQNNVGRSQQGRGRNVEQSQGDSNQSRARREPQAQSGPAAGTGEHLLKLRVKKGAEGGSTDNFVVSGEFDFEAGLGNFNKNEVLAKVAAERVIDEDSKYKKDDFFDSLSNDAVNRAAEGLQPRRSQAEERNLNQDTFGAIALQSNN